MASCATKFKPTFRRSTSHCRSSPTNPRSKSNPSASASSAHKTRPRACIGTSFLCSCHLPLSARASSLPPAERPLSNLLQDDQKNDDEQKQPKSAAGVVAPPTAVWPRGQHGENE